MNDDFLLLLKILNIFNTHTERGEIVFKMKGDCCVNRKERKIIKN